MHLHPTIAALRSDDAPQRQAQSELFAAVAQWREQEAGVLAALERYGAGEDIGDCQALADLLSKGARAAEFSGAFVRRTAQALVAAPLAHAPLRHFTDGSVSTLLLARAGRASLFLAAVNGTALAAQPRPRSVSYTASESREMILSGWARADLVSEHTEALDLSPGTAIHRDCTRQALILREVEGTLVLLRLLRRHADPVPTREVDLATGAPIHQAAATAEDSRAELMIALLGRMGRSDATPVLAGIARSEASPDLRWQALRECLGLDTAAGFEALTALAHAADDPLTIPAGALRAQLVESHPELALCLA